MKETNNNTHKTTMGDTMKDMSGDPKADMKNTKDSIGNDLRENKNRVDAEDDEDMNLNDDADVL